MTVEVHTDRVLVRSSAVVILEVTHTFDATASNR
jgi:hypothetical protein